MKRKTAGELADFFAQLPRGKNVEFHTINHEGFRRIAGGKLIEVGDDLHILIGPAEPADSVFITIVCRGRENGEL